MAGEVGEGWRGTGKRRRSAGEEAFSWKGRVQLARMHATGANALSWRGRFIQFFNEASNVAHAIRRSKVWSYACTAVWEQRTHMEDSLCDVLGYSTVCFLDLSSMCKRS